jgi:hypothetical protein
LQALAEISHVCGTMNVVLRLMRWGMMLVTGFLLTAAMARAEMKPAWVMLSADGDDSVMTVGANEKDALVKAGWSIEAEGSVHEEAVEGSALLHRMIHTTPQGIERMLESDPAAVEKWKAAGYVEEGLLGYVIGADASDRIAVTQFTRGPKRLWLTKASSMKTAEDKGWKKQGVQFWIWAAEPPSAAPANQ